jgi:hypothetical protein
MLSISKTATARSLLFSLTAAACVWAATIFPAAAATHELNPPGLADGPGIWANVWNYPTGDPDAYCNNLRAHGIRNLFIQTTRTNMPPIAHAPELGVLIDACHRHHIRVIGWAYLELADPSADAGRMVAAAKFRSPTGDCLDAIAPDLEKNLTVSRLESFSTKLRSDLGTNYPIIAVVYSPLNHYREVASIPWKTLAQYYDVIAPMNYWNSKSVHMGAYDYTVATVHTIREMCGRPDVEIHVIGDAMGTSGDDILQFLKACRQSEATSASIYPNQKPTADQLFALSHYGDFFEPNARFRLAAYRELLRTGVIANGTGIDPTQPVSRGDFYRMVAHRVHQQDPALEGNPGEQAPIYAHEALSVLAHIVDSSNHTERGPKRRADRWFAAPAMAEAPQDHTGTDRPLNWLDASVMILQVSSALK